MKNKYDVVVVGAGHAGIEAALASSRLGADTLLITNNIQRIGFMSCNPSIGGLGKGHIVKEIDVLGGAMGHVADKTCLQFKKLNASKGPAVRGTRIQCDKDLYSQEMANICRSQRHLDVAEGEISALILDGNRCVGVTTEDGSKIFGKTTVVTAGTFLRAVMHFGLKQIPGGRVGDRSSIGISDQLKDFGFKIGRFKTGTPARADAASIDWSKTSAQGGDADFIPFSLRSERQLRLPQINCFVTYTNEKTHEIIRANLDKSPMFCGVIEGVGPRYCPSIEDKITRFADKDRHQSFLEPEGLSTNSIYVQGISTSLPEEVQIEFLKTIPGLENVRLIRPGYAVEYDYIEPSQICHTLETRAIKSLFLAGQINGTSGYEEAAGQGLVAGMNAAFRVLESDPLILGRDQSYIGVMIDDLVTKGTKEPYRMMTSRAEHRLVLREDNALDRLGETAVERGLVDTATSEKYRTIMASRANLLAELRSKSVVPNADSQNKLKEIGSAVLLKPNTLEELLRRTEMDCFKLRVFGLSDSYEKYYVEEPVEIAVKYDGYIKRQLGLIEQARKMEDLRIPADLDFSAVRGLSTEEIEKLRAVRPMNLGQASRLSGVNPSALQAIMVHLKAFSLR